MTHSLLSTRYRNVATASDPRRGPAPPGGRTAAEQPLPGCYFGLGFRVAGFRGVGFSGHTGREGGRARGSEREREVYICVYTYRFIKLSLFTHVHICVYPGVCIYGLYACVHVSMRI